jgi:hypothetical protein
LIIQLEHGIKSKVQTTNKTIVYLIIALTVSSLLLLPTETKGSINTSATLTSSGYIQGNPTPTPTATPTPTPVAGVAPLLHVVGTHLETASGNIVTLRGVNWDWVTMYRYYGYSFASAVAQMKQWGINFVRFHSAACPLSEIPELYQSSYLSLLDSAINTCLSNGIYVQLDWMDWRGDTPYCQSLDSWSWSDVVAWWTFAAQRYSGKGIFYDIINEPTQNLFSDAGYQSAMMSIIGTIRSYDSTSIIVIEENNWSLAFQQTYPITGSNIMFNTHHYANGFGDGSDINQVSQQNIYNAMSSVAANWCIQHGYCVAVGEFGALSVTDQGSYSCTFMQNLMAVCDANGYSGYAAFWWSVRGGNNLIADIYGTPTPTGAVIKDYYISH